MWRRAVAVAWGLVACGPSVGDGDSGVDAASGAATDADTSTSGPGASGASPSSGDDDTPATTTDVTTATADATSSTPPADTGDEPDEPKLDLPVLTPVGFFECCYGSPCEGGVCINEMCIPFCEDDPGECPPPPDGSNAVVGCVPGGGDQPGPFESSYCAFACGFNGCPEGFACGEGGTCVPIACPQD